MGGVTLLDPIHAVHEFGKFLELGPLVVVLLRSDRSGPAEGVKGVVEDLEGKAKEATGAVAGNDSPTREGQAQQDKAEAQREVAEKEAAADKAHGKADVHEARERSEQD